MNERPGAAKRFEDRDSPRSTEEASAEVFVSSMPRKYRQLFDDGAVRAHAAIVARREGRAAHAEIWKVFPPGGVAICVAAEDQAGLLARISAALVAHDLDVVAAQVYSRKRSAGVEAVDFFWVRRLKGPMPVDEDVQTLARTLDHLVAGRAGLELLRRIAPVAPGTHAQTRVGFESDALDGTVVLTVQGTDRPGLLFLISTALFSENVRITRSDVATFEGRVLDRFHLTEPDGSPLRRSRLLGIQTATLAAIDCGQAP